MPLYEYLCDNGHRSEGVRPMAESAMPQLCPSCRKTAWRILSPTRVFGDFEGYESPVTGKWVEGRRARLEDLKRNHCRPYEDGEREQFALRAAAEDRELDKTIDEIVEQTAAEIRL